MVDILWVIYPLCARTDTDTESREYPPPKPPCASKRNVVIDSSRGLSSGAPRSGFSPFFQILKPCVLVSTPAVEAVRYARMRVVCTWLCVIDRAVQWWDSANRCFTAKTRGFWLIGQSCKKESPPLPLPKSKNSCGVKTVWVIVHSEWLIHTPVLTLIHSEGGEGGGHRPLQSGRGPVGRLTRLDCSPDDAGRPVVTSSRHWTFLDLCIHGPAHPPRLIQQECVHGCLAFYTDVPKMYQRL